MSRTASCLRSLLSHTRPPDRSAVELTLSKVGRSVTYPVRKRKGGHGYLGGVRAPTSFQPGQLDPPIQVIRLRHGQTPNQSCASISVWGNNGLREENTNTKEVVHYYPQAVSSAGQLGCLHKSTRLYRPEFTLQHKKTQI